MCCTFVLSWHCRRYLQLEPTHAEEFVAYLKQKERWGEAAKRLSGMLNDDTFRSIEGKSKHQLWLELCELITKHPAEVMAERIDVDAILRGGIRKYKDEVRCAFVVAARVSGCVPNFCGTFG
jgi:pre-mRNA-splicing factor SYF1